VLRSARMSCWTRGASSRDEWGIHLDGVWGISYEPRVVERLRWARARRSGDTDVPMLAEGSVLYSERVWIPRDDCVLNFSGYAGQGCNMLVPHP